MACRRSSSSPRIIHTSLRAGQVKLARTVYGSRFFYSPYTSSNTASQSQKTLHARYELRGTVKDESGNPIEGAALRIGKDEVFTNAAGEFSVRSVKNKVGKVEVVSDEFLAGRSETVTAPPAVETGKPIQIVVRIYIE